MSVVKKMKQTTQNKYDAKNIDTPESRFLKKLLEHHFLQTGCPARRCRRSRK